MQEVPPSGLGPLGKREERLAWGMLLPTNLISLINNYITTVRNFLD